MKKFLFSIAVAAILGGCTLLSPKPTEPQWSKYLENDGNVENIAFYSENLAQTKELKNGTIIGMAVIEKDGIIVKLGDMYAFNKLSFTILELNDKELFGYRDINMHDKNEHERLKTAKSIKFYQFGGGVLETVVFSANGKAVCENFGAGKKVNARAVTNYYEYDDPTNTQFFATLMDVEVVKGGAGKIKNLDFKYFLPDSKLAKIKEMATSANFKSKVIDADAKKQEQILSSLVCVTPEEY